MIGGFVMPTTGTVEIGGVDVTRLGPEKRPTNMVFQGYGLFPHMNVRQNIAYGLRIAEAAARRDRPGASARCWRWCISASSPTAPIQELSGGQQQRVALARALVMRPQVLLLDEPLAALDLKLRQAMQEELRRIHQEIGGTFVFVTHDQGEALALANRIAVMEAGELVQQGDAEEIYARPRTRFVSTFIGEANVFEAQRRDGTVEFAGMRVAVAGAGRTRDHRRAAGGRAPRRRSRLATDVAVRGHAGGHGLSRRLREIPDRAARRPARSPQPAPTAASAKAFRSARLSGSAGRSRTSG